MEIDKKFVFENRHPKKLKGLSLGLGFQFFEYFANLLQISNKIIDNNKKIWFLSMDLSINFEN
jgi:hypothetical protein